MSVRFDASGEYLARQTNLPNPNLFTIMGCVQLVADRNATSELFNLIDGGGAGVRMLTASDGTTLRLASTNGSNLMVAQWYHLAITKNGSSVRGLINGVVDINATDNVSFTPAYFLIGFPTNWPNARFAHVRIWDAVLSDAEILAEMRSPVVVRTANLNSAFPFTTSVTQDVSGFGRNLVIGGGAPSLEAVEPFAEGVQTILLPLLSQSAEVTVEVSSAGISAEQSLSLGLVEQAGSAQVHISAVQAATLPLLGLSVTSESRIQVEQDVIFPSWLQDGHVTSGIKALQDISLPSWMQISDVTIAIQGLQELDLSLISASANVRLGLSASGTGLLPFLVQAATAVLSLNTGQNAVLPLTEQDTSVGLKIQLEQDILLPGIGKTIAASISLQTSQSITFPEIGQLFLCVVGSPPIIVRQDGVLSDLEQSVVAKLIVSGHEIADLSRLQVLAEGKVLVKVYQDLLLTHISQEAKIGTGDAPRRCSQSILLPAFVETSSVKLLLSSQQEVTWPILDYTLSSGLLIQGVASPLFPGVLQVVHLHVASLFRMPPEERMFWVDPEDRYFHIESEDRIEIIPSEDRIERVE